MYNCHSSGVMQVKGKIMIGGAQIARVSIKPLITPMVSDSERRVFLCL